MEFTLTIGVHGRATPTPPDGFEIAGYTLAYDGPSLAEAEGKTLREAADKMARDLCEFRVYCECADDDGGVMVCEWSPQKQTWGEWEWA